MREINRLIANTLVEDIWNEVHVTNHISMRNLPYTTWHESQYPQHISVRAVYTSIMTELILEFCKDTRKIN